MSPASDIEKHPEDVVALPVLTDSNDVTPSSGSSPSSIHSGDKEKKAITDGKVDLDQVDLALPAKLGYSSVTRWLYRTYSLTRA